MRDTSPLIGLFMLLFALPARAQWTVDGNVVCTASGVQAVPDIASDGAGGAFVTWADSRGADYDIYVQRLDASGAAQWTSNGVAICTAALDQADPRMIADGAGGAIVVWSDKRTGGFDIYAQRINSSGTVMWTANGVALCAASGTQIYPGIIRDGAGGAIVTWTDYRTGSPNTDIYAQRIDATGVVQWTTDGVAICAVPGTQFAAVIASDVTGGAIITWQDNRVGAIGYDIYAQRVNSTGNTLWTPNGVALCTVANDQLFPVIVADGSSGAIVAWPDARANVSDIYAQRVSSTGSVQWTANGVAVCTATNSQSDVLYMVADGSGGAIMAWHDLRNGPYDIYAQRMSGGGVAQWTADGVAVSAAAGDQQQPTLASDGAGGAVVTWYDSRGGTLDIYAQRLSATGVSQWTPDGIVLCSAAGDQDFPVIAGDGLGGAVVAWEDARSGARDVYAQRVSAAGNWGHPEPTIVSIVDTPGDQGKSVTIRFMKGDRHSPTYDGYIIYRDDSGTWTFVDAGYVSGGGIQSVVVPTLDDSTCIAPLGHQFRVKSFDDFGGPDEYSAAAMGRSKDNIAPPPSSLWMTRVGGTVTLHWTPSTAFDLDSYSVYMSTIPGPPGTSYFATAYDTTFTAVFVSPFTDQYWSVAAWDVHCNRSTPSNVAAFLLPNTPVGNDVVVNPYDDNGSGRHPLSATFSNVTQEGRTSLSITGTGPTLPGSFTLGDSKYYNVTTTATWTGNIYICLEYDESSLTVPEASLRLLHYDTALLPPAWVDVTDDLDTDSNQICGFTDHLSPFVIGAGSATAVGDDPAPKVFALHPNVPNPFNPVTTISYQVPTVGHVSITVYDVAGRHVRTLLDEHRPAGAFSLQWHGDDDRGQRVASGVYFYRMRADGFVDTRKMVLLK